jgi:aminomethyltransferase
MGRVRIEGPDTVPFLQKVLSSDVASLEMGKAQYCIIPNANGGAVDDAYLYRFEEDHYFLVVNASNTDKDLEHFAQNIQGFNCTVTNVTGDCASIAIQGPDSEALLKGFAKVDTLTEAKRNALNILDFEGRRIKIARTGYTGEPLSYELFVESGEAVWLWNRLLELGAKPAGLGARDTLRLEAGLPLYGHEFGMDAEDKEIPIFAVPLSRFAVSLVEGKEDLIGRAALEEQSKAVEKKMYFICLVDRGVMRAGMKVYRGDEEIGYITSGTMVPYMTEKGSVNRSIGIAYLKSDVKAEDMVHIDVRGKKLKAAIVSRHMKVDATHAIPVVYGE